MRQRHQTGGLRKQRGRWLGMWWVDGKRKSRVLGFVKDMTKSKAREEVGKIVAEENAKRKRAGEWHFGDFVIQVYFPFYSRKWKRSTVGVNKNRILKHLCLEFASRELRSFRRDELQDLLDRKATNLSFSMVDHLRWDLKQVFDLALEEGIVERNPAALIWTPREAPKPVRGVMSSQDVRTCFLVLATRERLIAKLAILAGMRPGEIFALTWGALDECSAQIRQRVYRGVIDTPKTNQSVRQAALPETLLFEIGLWREMAVSTADKAWVFPSENMTPLAKENVWRRHMKARLEDVSLGWANFQVMRRTHSSLMKALGVDGKLVADQLGHSLDVNQNVYTQSAVELRQAALNRLESSIGKEVEINA